MCLTEIPGMAFWYFIWRRLEIPSRLNRYAMAAREVFSLINSRITINKLSNGNTQQRAVPGSGDNGDFVWPVTSTVARDCHYRIGTYIIFSGKRGPQQL